MEEWRDINGFEGKYQVSNEGRVRSLDRFVLINNKTCPHKRFTKGKILSPLKDKQGYMSVCLGEGSKRYLVHRLVYEAFVGNIPNDMQVNHIDENKSNNNLDNLNLLTPKDNVNYGTGMERSSIKQGTKIYQYSEDKILIKVHNSLRRASKLSGFSRTYLKKRIIDNKPHKGYIWSRNPI